MRGDSVEVFRQRTANLGFENAAWDAAHNVLQGREHDLALEIVWPHLGIINQKNAIWKPEIG